MARWLNTLDISDLYRQAEAREIMAKTFAAGAGARLAALVPALVGVSPSQRVEAERLAECLEYVGENTEADFNDHVDPLLSELYDWGDEAGEHRGSKICWIRTAL